MKKVGLQALDVSKRRDESLLWTRNDLHNGLGLNRARPRPADRSTKPSQG
jgi:hypothetical protein